MKFSDFLKFFHCEDFTNKINESDITNMFLFNVVSETNYEQNQLYVISL